MPRWTGEPLEFNNQNAVPDHYRHAQRWLDDSAYVRKHMACDTDIRYGDHPRERLDVFPCPVPGAPVLIFIHGGWFQFLDKSSLSFVAPPFVQHGATVVTISYPLTPQDPIPRIVDAAARAVLWTRANIARYNGDPERISVAGHSAGGHLALSMGVRDWTAETGSPALLRGCFPISGIYDMAPVTETVYNAAIRVSAETAPAWSPLGTFARAPDRLIASVGGEETSGFLWQHRALLGFCAERGISCTDMTIPGRNHYSIVEEFCRAKSPLFATVAAAL